jgi:hypothetical protein
MKLSTAVHVIALAHTYFWYVPSVLCKKESMRDGITSTTVEQENNNNNNYDERSLQSSLSSNNDYSYRRNYVAVIEPENFVSYTPNGGTIAESIVNDYINGGSSGRIPQLQGSTTILNGT